MRIRILQGKDPVYKGGEDSDSSTVLVDPLSGTLISSELRTTQRPEVAGFDRVQLEQKI
jgi:hypothetical protein